MTEELEGSEFSTGGSASQADDRTFLKEVYLVLHLSVALAERGLSTF